MYLYSKAITTRERGKALLRSKRLPREDREEMALLFLDTIIQEFLVVLEDNRPPAMQLAGECRDASGLYRFDQELYKA